MDAIVDGLTRFFQVLGMAFDGVSYLASNIWTWFQQIAVTFNYAPPFLYAFLSISLTLTALVGILKWLPF